MQDTVLTKLLTFDQKFFSDKKRGDFALKITTNNSNYPTGSISFIKNRSSISFVGLYLYINNDENDIIGYEANPNLFDNARIIRIVGESKAAQNPDLINELNNKYKFEAYCWIIESGSQEYSGFKKLFEDLDIQSTYEQGAFIPGHESNEPKQRAFYFRPFKEVARNLIRLVLIILVLAIISVFAE